MQERITDHCVNLIALASGVWAGYSAVEMSLQAGARPYVSLSINLLHPLIAFNIPFPLKCFLVGWAMGSLVGVATINQVPSPLSTRQTERGEQQSPGISGIYRTHLFQ